jgi:opacity protein-like surface antigen
VLRDTVTFRKFYMKHIYCFMLILLPAYAFCQQDSTTSKPPQQKKPSHSLGLGIKAGLNFTNITSASSISNSSETGFQVGLFLDPSTKSILGSRTELLYSHQGYNYATGETTGKVYLDYIMLAQLMAINITHFVQIQLGTQKAENDQPSTGNASADAIINYYNRVDFGFSGGLEVRPFMGIIVGARYNLSLTNLYKIPTSDTGNVPDYIPSTSDLNFKNNLVQVYVGYRF